MAMEQGADNTYKLSIKPKRSWFLIVFAAIWLTLWMIGGAFAFSELFASDAGIFLRLFLLLWLCGWVLGVVFVGGLILYNFFGHQVMLIGSNRITTYKWIFRPWLRRSYALDQISSPAIEYGRNTTSARHRVRHRQDDDAHGGTGADRDRGQATLTVRNGEGKRVTLLRYLERDEAESILSVLTKLIKSDPAPTKIQDENAQDADHIADQLTARERGMPKVPRPVDDDEISWPNWRDDR